VPDGTLRPLHAAIVRERLDLVIALLQHDARSDNVTDALLAGCRRGSAPPSDALLAITAMCQLYSRLQSSFLGDGVPIGRTVALVNETLHRMEE